MSKPPGYSPRSSAPLARAPLSLEAAVEVAAALRESSQPARLGLLSVIAHHLKMLRTAGLLDSERRGSWVYYRAIPAALQHLSAVQAPDDATVTG